MVDPADSRMVTVVECASLRCIAKLSSSSEGAVQVVSWLHHQVSKSVYTGSHLGKALDSTHLPLPPSLKNHQQEGQSSRTHSGERRLEQLLCLLWVSSTAWLVRSGWGGGAFGWTYFHSIF